MNETERILSGNTDARDWAREFAKVFKEIYSAKLYMLLGELALPPYPDGAGGTLFESCRIDCAPIAQHIQKRVEESGLLDLDEGWLIGWFANAIETGSMRSDTPQMPSRHIRYQTPENRSAKELSDAQKLRTLAEYFDLQETIKGTRDEFNDEVQRDLRRIANYLEKE